MNYLNNTKLIDMHLVNPNGVWRSKEHEPNTIKCSSNLIARLKMLSENENNFIAEWSYIIGQSNDNKIKKTKDHNKKIENPNFKGKSIDKTSLCLCGMCIDIKYYVINDLNKNICQIGSKCIERFNPELLKKYKEKLNKGGECYICNKYYKDINRHCSSKTFIVRELQGFHSKRIKLLENHLHLLLTHRKCTTPACKNYIKNEEPKWKIRCISCYKNLKN